MKLTTSVACFALATSACAATVPAPRESLTMALDRVQNACDAGAQASPDANERLSRARAEVDRAIALMHEGNNADATRLLSRANVDAQLALELAREGVVDGRVREARAVVEATREGK
jgi:hypothetical protein